MSRRATKIVATLGPASSDPALLEAMIRAGVNVVRLNFSHGKAQDHVDRARLVREASKRAGREVAIMADLQGPKIRVGKFAEGKVMLEPGAAFVLDASRTKRARSTWSCALPWLKFKRTTLTPARIMASNKAGSLEAGPKVATILVARRVIRESPCNLISIFPRKRLHKSFFRLLNGGCWGLNETKLPPNGALCTPI